MSNKHPFKTKRYDLFKDGITQSALTLWLYCREQFRLRYCEGWRKKVDPEYFIFGTAFHKCLEILRDEHCPSLKLIKKVVKKVINLENKIKFSTTAVGINEILYSKLVPLIYRYFYYWHAKNGKDYKLSFGHLESRIRVRKWIGFEENIIKSIKVKGTKHNICLRGKVDSSFQCVSKYKWITDTKTSSSLSEKTVGSSVKDNLQLLFYSYIVGNVEGVVLNFVKKPGLRCRQKETLIEYRKRINEHIKCFPKKYFIRYTHRFQKDEVDNWERKFLQPVLYELVQWWKGNRKHYTNINAYHTRYGVCELYYLLTTGQSIGYKRSKVPFPELED